MGISKHHMCWTTAATARYFQTAPSFSVNSFQLGKIKQVLEVATCHILTCFALKEDVSNEARLNFDKACLAFVLFFVSTNDPTREEISRKTFPKLKHQKSKLILNILLFSDMDGIGSPDSLMEHSMLDIKNSSPYACYSPKLSYEVFPSNRGKQRNISTAEIFI